jgi:hypothetical protein
MTQEERERNAAEKFLGPNTCSGQVYDVVKFLDAIFLCRDVEIVHRGVRVARHVLGAVQEKLQHETTSRYYEEAYGLKKAGE